MTKTRNALLGLSTAALIATGGTMTATAAQPTVSAKPASVPTQTGPDTEAEAKKWKSCPKGAICFYTKKNGQGKKYAIHGKTNKNLYGIKSRWSNADTSEDKYNALTKVNNRWTCTPAGSKWNHDTVTIDAVRWKGTAC